MLSFVKRNIFLFIFCVGFTLFALSNTITASDKIVLEYALPEEILRFFAIFQASSRMFYVVYYMFFLAAIVGILRNWNSASVIFLLALMVGLQVVDISPALSVKKAYFNKHVAAAKADTVPSELETIVSHYQYVIVEGYEFSRSTVISIGKANAITNANIANRPYSSNSVARQFYEQCQNDLFSGKINEKYIYAFSDSDKYSQAYQINIDSVYPVEMEGLFWLIPKKDGVTIREERISVPAPPLESDTELNSTEGMIKTLGLR